MEWHREYENNWIYYVEPQQMEPRPWNGSSGGGGQGELTIRKCVSELELSTVEQAADGW